MTEECRIDNRNCHVKLNGRLVSISYFAKSLEPEVILQLCLLSSPMLV